MNKASIFGIDYFKPLIVNGKELSINSVEYKGNGTYVVNCENWNPEN